MPTEKRQRQKEGRRVRLEARRKAQRRRALIRRSAIILIVAAAVVGSVFLITGGSSPAKKHKLTAQEIVDKAAVKAGCSATAPTQSHPATTQKWKKPPKFDLKAKTDYLATIDTTQGAITAELNTSGAPENTNNFVFLARHHFYNCQAFFRVIPQFMAQGGDPTDTGELGPGYVVPDNEFPKPVKSGNQYQLGAIAMANSCPQTITDPSKCPPTNGSQFFIVGGPEGESLPARYTLIGQVLSGLPVVEKIVAQGNPSTASNGEPPEVTNRILSVTISAVPEK